MSALREARRLPDGLSAIFNLQTGFNPQSGKLSDGLGSIVQNNGLPVNMQNSFADSAKDGQAFNVAAYAGLSSPTYGTLTYGRQNALTSDGVVNYDPMSNSGAFSLIGFQGLPAVREIPRIASSTIRSTYAVNFGAFRAAVETQIRSGAFSAPGNAIRGTNRRGLCGLVSRRDLQSRHGCGFVSSAQYCADHSRGQFGYKPGAGLVSGTVSDNTSVMLLLNTASGRSSSMAAMSICNSRIRIIH